MPSPIPQIPGLTALWSTALDFGLSEPELHQELQAAGVQVLELSVSGRKSLFAHRTEIEQFLLSRARPAQEVRPEPPPKPTTTAGRLKAQEAELAALRAQVDALITQKGDGR